MRELGLKGLLTRRVPRGTRATRVISLVLVRREYRRKRARSAVDDRHHRATNREGKVYCCVVLDAFSRYVVGWAIASTQTTTHMAIRRRNGQDGLGIHSDPGVQFTCWAFGTRFATPAWHRRWEQSAAPTTTMVESL